MRVVFASMLLLYWAGRWKEDYVAMNVSGISTKRLNELNKGLSPTTKLAEWLAVDQATLLSAVAETYDLTALRQIAEDLPNVSVPKQIAWIGQQIPCDGTSSALDGHVSDIVRCWACYARVAVCENLKDALHATQPFAIDPHFGVREIAWMAVRDRICADPILAVTSLVPWTASQDACMRRFASEATRPRGVWAKHIGEFKRNPEPARPLLDLLCSDSSRYVQDSVANWLNDAAKDNPDWVKTVCASWKRESDSKATAYIIKRAQRSLK